MTTPNYGDGGAGRRQVRKLESPGKEKRPTDGRRKKDSEREGEGDGEEWRQVGLLWGSWDWGWGGETDGGSREVGPPPHSSDFPPCPNTSRERFLKLKERF